ncbi:hypothetical protein ANOM_008522 [Aspergillus nomiae NRRL 13137]|uniref:Uncharacterized protein n=1 Tax=Aspergillus nomiae NRRL (strain ATCC 15546 / NRRL 13137 / CBS 260.88 / M93) TaxID=1509407 RepID=A0A0L1ITP2_ASPN3|nr:uncharacterized protein ANOM_008522 [Aspergillus nomiae NRRL 13137]KNG82872.1 hypothetical protein ANOM_008522 [Aspergillus nomiae NRRL 13137]
MALHVSLNLASLHRASGAEINNAKLTYTIYGYQKALDKSEEPIIPDPQLFQPSSCLTSTNQHDLPSISKCAVHLELLEVFHALRDKVQQSTDLDKTFGIKPNKRTVYRKRYSSKKRKYESYTATVGDDTFSIRRENKWPYFLELAVCRFTRWIRVVNKMSCSSADSQNVNEPSGLGPLPPVDVLMVWHAFLLNPVDFDFYCVKHKLERVRKAPLPWQQIHEAINQRDWSYRLPKAQKDWLEKQADFVPDLFETLVEIGKGKSHAKHVLSQYGSSSKTSPFSLLKYVDTPANYAFVEMVQATKAEALRNNPLKNNVERQFKFVEKMHAHLWIRSPAVEGTLRRAIDRYDKFLQLFRDYPTTTLVPTLDVDLVWHTHLSDPEQYRTSLNARAGRMISHDDKLGKSFLDIRFNRTHDLFQMAFGQQYNVCLCWDCEAITSAMEAFAANDDMDILDDIDCDADSIVKEVENDLRYYRAVEIARRKGVALPVR